MKKTLLLLSLISGLSAASYAQGTFQWGAPAGTFVAQTNTTAFSAFVTSQGTPAGNGIPSGQGLASGSITFPIYYTLLTSSGLSSSATSLSQFTGTLANAWLDTGLTMTNTTGNNGRMTAFGANGNAVVAGNWASGASQNAMMVGWSGNLGTTFAAALAKLNAWASQGASVVGTAYFGVSTVATGIVPTTGNPGQAVFGTGSSSVIDGSVAGDRDRTHRGARVSD